MNTDKPHPKLFIAIVVFTAVTLFCTTFSFAVPLWIERKSGTYNQFVRLGLWVACFEGYMHRETYTRSYYGCWYIYHSYFDDIRSWINPGWMYACQVLYTAAFIMQIISMVVIACQACRMLSIYHIHVLRGHIFFQFLSACCMVITIICFGQKSGDTRYMPKPQLNTLSWSFGFAVVSLGLTLITFVMLFYLYIRRHDEVQEQEKALEQQKLLPNEAAYDPRAPPLAYQPTGEPGNGTATA